MLSKLVQSVLDYCELNNNHDRQMVCDYRIKIDENIESNRTHYPGLEKRNCAIVLKFIVTTLKLVITMISLKNTS